jgi:dienelactone hydrolase
MEGTRMRIVPTLVLLLATSLSQAASNFSFSNAPGPYPVGLKVVLQYDYARAYRGEIDAVTGEAIKGERARPIQTLVWYPARPGGKAMVYGDYLRLTGNEDDFSRTDKQAQAIADEIVRNDYGSMSGPERVREELPGRMRAHRDAASANGRFPVVIYAPSIGAPAAENADLCEYLASHGYIVIASPSFGPRSRAMPNDLEGAETQAADIAFLVAYAHTLPQADSGEVAVAGYSWGGLANVLAAARDSRIKALVNLDGSVRYYPDLVAASKYVTPLSVHVPMLYLAQTPMSLEQVAERGKPAASFLNEMKYADLYKLTMYPMHHFAFSSTYLRFVPDDMYKQYDRAEVNRAFGWTATYVLRFLDAYLKHDVGALAFLNAPPVQNGIPRHAATMDVRKAAGEAPSRAALAAELARRGFGHALDAYQAMHAREAAFELKADELNEWGYGLLRAGEPGKAVDIFKLATSLYPTNANAFDSLAEACWRAGDKQGAIANYQRSLQLDPTNTNAQQRLSELGVQTAKGG